MENVLEHYKGGETKWYAFLSRSTDIFRKKEEEKDRDRHRHRKVLILFH